MILYKPYEHIDSSINSNLWVILPGDYEVNRGSFKTMYFKIDNIVYKTFSDSFKKAYEQERIWRALNRG